MSEMQTYFRVQSADRDVTELLDPACQYSHAWYGGPGHTRVGISVCDSLDDLALYLASHLASAIRAEICEDAWVVVELEGNTIPGSRPVDPEFETLIRPTRIVSVRPVDATFIALIAEKDTFLASFDDNPWFDDEEAE